MGDARMDGWMMRMDGWMGDARMDGWMGGARMDGWVMRWMGWMDG